MPAEVAANLQAVVEFLESAAHSGADDEVVRRQFPGPAWVPLAEKVTVFQRGHTAERRLVAAMLDVPRLVDLFGDASPVVTAADLALTRTTDVYHALLKGSTRKYRYGSAVSAHEQVAGIDQQVASSRSAVDAYVAAIEGLRPQ